MLRFCFQDHQALQQLAVEQSSIMDAHPSNQPGMPSGMQPLTLQL